MLSIFLIYKDLYSKLHYSIPMKKFIFTLLCSALAMSLYAQKSLTLVNKALNKGEFSTAKTLIETALKDPKISKKPKAWLTKAVIYDSLAFSTDDIKQKKAYIKTAIEMYSKFAEMKGGAEKAFAGEQFGNGINQVLARGGQKTTPYKTMGQKFYNEGVVAYQAEDHKKAQQQFYLASLTNKKDTVAHENAIRMAYQNDPVDYEMVKEVSNRMITNGLKKEFAYQALLEASENIDKDNVGKVIADAKKEFPNNQFFMLKEINHYIASGKTDEAIVNLEQATQKDPENYALYLNLGLLYEQTEKPDLALKNYKKAYEIKPEEYNVVYSLGGFLFNQGIKINNEAGSLSDSEYKTKGKELEAQAAAKFKESLPYFEEALKIKNDEEQLLNALYSIYKQFKQEDKAQEIKALIDKL